MTTKTPVKTGMTIFDALSGSGFVPGQMITIAGASKGGKSVYKIKEVLSTSSITIEMDEDITPYKDMDVFLTF